MNVTWVRILSWHAASGLVSRGAKIHTRCGRWAAANSDMLEELPAGKSCETCLRIVAKRADA